MSIILLCLAGIFRLLCDHLAVPDGKIMVVAFQAAQEGVCLFACLLYNFMTPVKVQLKSTLLWLFVLVGGLVFM